MRTFDGVIFPDTLANSREPVLEVTSRSFVIGYVRFGSKADMCSAKPHVRFTPMCGRLRVGKDFLHVCSIGRCAHVFGLCVRHTRPLAIMPSADQVPINNPHSTMLGGNWVVLIAGSTGSALRAVRPPNVHITPDVRRDLGYAASATGCL